MPTNLTIRKLYSGDADFAEQLRALRASTDGSPMVRRQVAAIFRQIRRNGDAAILALTAAYDRHQVAAVADLQVPAARLAQALDAIPAVLREDLELAAARLRDYHQRQVLQGWTATDAYGNRIGEIIRPVQRAVIYAPGGKAAYPSSVLMGAIPAMVAGVDDVILTTPAPDGEVSDITLAAAAIAGIQRVFLLGGAQAIIGFALGGKTLPQADVIVGPGNAYVAEAKRQVFGLVGLDSIAGPSEVLILCDNSTPPDWLAADMAAQAEHDEMAQSIVLSADAEHIEQVAAALHTLLPNLARQRIIGESLQKRGAFILADTIDSCCDIANRIAAEHVQIMTRDADAVAARIRHGGGLFIGRYSCVPFGDYLAGPNHVLPTNGTARFSSPLGVHHFVKRSGVLTMSADGAAALSPATARLAEAEGLSAHAVAARLRAPNRD